MFSQRIGEYTVKIGIVMAITYVVSGFNWNQELFTGIVACFALFETCKG